MVGLRPVIEFMTWNFALLAIDQIVNSAAKMRYMSGGQVGVPARLPRARAAPRCSSARSTPRRSRAYYAHIPGLKVVTPATPADAKGLLKSAIRDDNPVVFIEGEMLYDVKGEVPDGEQAGDPLAVALRRAHHQGEVQGPGQDRHIGDRLDRRRRVLHIEAAIVEAGALEERQNRRVAGQIDPRADLHLARGQRSMHRVRLDGHGSVPMVRAASPRTGRGLH